jgi:hypothetical protein
MKIIDEIKRIINKIPKYKMDVWYNASIWMKEEKYPIIFDKDKRYIDCKMGLKVIMGEDKNKNKIYYTVIKIYREKGSDYFYSSDAIYCNLKYFGVDK